MLINSYFIEIYELNVCLIFMDFNYETIVYYFEISINFFFTVDK
jgi:hypothetical protein